jgi:hypothetical protein
LQGYLALYELPEHLVQNAAIQAVGKNKDTWFAKKQTVFILR